MRETVEERKNRLANLKTNYDLVLEMVRGGMDLKKAIRGYSECSPIRFFFEFITEQEREEIERIDKQNKERDRKFRDYEKNKIQGLAKRGRSK